MVSMVLCLETARNIICYLEIYLFILLKYYTLNASRRNTLVDDSIVINNILQWVEDGNPEISDDEDDLHELYGDEEDGSMHVQEAIGEESVAAHSQDTEIQ